MLSVLVILGQSLSLSPLACEDQDNDNEEEEESIPEHEFEIKTTEGKFGKMKGVVREKVSLITGSDKKSKRGNVVKSRTESLT